MRPEVIFLPLGGRGLAGLFHYSKRKKKPSGIQGTTLPEGDEIRDGRGIGEQKGRGKRELRNKRRSNGINEKRESWRGSHEKLSHKFSLSEPSTTHQSIIRSINQ